MDDKKREYEEVELFLDEFEKSAEEQKKKAEKTDLSDNEKVDDTIADDADLTEAEDKDENVDETDNAADGKPKKKHEKWDKFVAKWKSLKKWKRVVIIVVAVILILAIIAFGVIYGVYGGFRTKVDENNLGISSEIVDKYGNTDIFNVAIFGVDTRDEDAFSGRSDSIIIVSVDKKNNDVKLTSILRDSYVEIEGHSNQKITHAYALGGAELAIKTINQNFNMNITDYATINFYKLADAIDVLGGIDIEITESEMKQINDEALGGSQKGAALVNDYGMVHLDGDQATIYTRLRHYDSDEVRSQRQKTVINALITQAKKVSPTKYAEVVKTLMSLCETSLSFSEVMTYAPMITQDITVEAITVPGEPENAIGGKYDGAWVWRYDLKAAADRIHMFIYGEVPETTTSSTTKKAAKTTTTKANTDNTPANKTTTAKSQPATTEKPVTTSVETTVATTKETTTQSSEETVTQDSAA